MNPMASLTMYDALTVLVSGYLLSKLFLPEMQDCSDHMVAFWIICYIIGLIYHRLFDVVAGKCKVLRNNPKWIKRAHCKVQKRFPRRLKKTPTQENYHDAYYGLMKNNCIGNIPVLEAQVAFCRDMIPILCVYVFVINCCCDSKVSEMMECLFGTCSGSCFLMLAIVLLALVWYFTQMKIHKLVWEGSCFINDKEGNKEN